LFVCLLKKNKVKIKTNLLSLLLIFVVLFLLGVLVTLWVIGNGTVLSLLCEVDRGLNAARS
jgi:hypothetical protein